MLFQGFEPFINSDSKLLILGSFPSIKSREEGFYYGNKQNRFWKILAESFGCSLPQTITEKKQMLTLHKVALWDMVIACEIKGSMDKDIKNPEIADIKSLMESHKIEKIITNGGTAHKLFIDNFPQLAYLCVPLPSTSPANARLDKKIWITALRDILWL